MTLAAAEAVSVARIGVVTVSDRVSAGSATDQSGPAVHEYFAQCVVSPWEPVLCTVADERDEIARVLRELADGSGCSLIVTTGGTGPAPRDVTPEATRDVCDRILPGFGEAMRAVSVRTVPTAVLSRQLAGSRGKTLIINLPGRPASIDVCLDAVIQAIPPCIRLLGGVTFRLADTIPAKSATQGEKQ